MSAVDLAVNALRTFGDTQDGTTVDQTFDLTGEALEELQNKDLTKADNDLFNSLIDGKSADKRKLNGDGTILSVVQNATTVWALQGGERVPHVYVGTTGTWTDNLGGDVDANWTRCDNKSLSDKIESLANGEWRNPTLLYQSAGESSSERLKYKIEGNKFLIRGIIRGTFVTSSLQVCRIPINLEEQFSSGISRSDGKGDGYVAVSNDVVAVTGNVNDFNCSWIIIDCTFSI